jgi:hypothetical protein
LHNVFIYLDALLSGDLPDAPHGFDVWYLLSLEAVEALAYY